MNRTQNALVLRALLSSVRLTARQVSRIHNIDRLSARIYNLREYGWPITTRMMELPSGKRVAEYYIAEEVLEAANERYNAQGCRWNVAEPSAEISVGGHKPRGICDVLAPILLKALDGSEWWSGSIVCNFNGLKAYFKAHLVIVLNSDGELKDIRPIWWDITPYEALFPFAKLRDKVLELSKK